MPDDQDDISREPSSATQPVDGDSASEPSSTDAAQPERVRIRIRTKKKRSFVRRHKALTALAGMLALLVLVVLGGVLYLNSKLGQVDHVEITLPENGRPPHASTGPGKDALNILVAGTDNGNGPSVAAAVASG